ncbi:phosphoglycerate mutase-like protein [Neocallimastix lanati (nom. inval.)]|jgi:transcription factor C subunit 7|uniref:Phosphoglycerate mutase-like protein n=1 Tax=Neocallimastix californiae TaxID=1754190 RepID=A0A1Y2DU09_9FUNG|nr:phosphoglycerate mutase-like protein [Neocallimastix sp. JGI-2020a]ORY62758.1 phosphoglycerate mutase-like protein [Neocallimastix californiae]|eukprot:ORY62758.1 phosphoglycerate mutase-like protein [Neocallimastix californiae]
MKTIYITRHGTRQDHLTGVPTPSKSGFIYDPPLAEEGLYQSQLLANYLLENAHIDYIFSSPFYRTLQTATKVANTLNLKIEVESGLSDWYGGSPNYATFIPKAAPYEKLIEFFPAIDKSYKPNVEIKTIAEPKDEMYDRIGKTIQILMNNFKSKDDKKDQEFLFVCHAASAIMVARNLLKDKSAFIRCGVCSLLKLTQKDEYSDWILEENGFTDYLKPAGGEKYVWTFPGESQTEE